MRGVKILMALIAVSSLALVAWLPQRARAATCYGASCNGLNPVTTGCSSDAYVVSSGAVNNVFSYDQMGTVYLLWSPTCQAGYTQTVTLEGDDADLIQARIRNFGSGGDYFTNANNVSSVVSPLLSAGSPSNLCSNGHIRIGPVGGGSSGTGLTGGGC